MKFRQKNPLIEDLVSGWMHILGIALAIIGTIALVSHSYSTGDGWRVLATLIFGLALILMYSTSAAYHLCQSEERKKKLRKLDHSAIYILIAATYTPFCLITLRESGSMGWIVLGASWMTAVIGIVLSYKKMKSNVSLVKTIGYIAMGLIIVGVIPSFIDVIDVGNNRKALYWLFAGGALDIIGCVPYMFSKFSGMHSLWHLFVMGGSVCHYIAIWSL